MTGSRHPEPATAVASAPPAVAPERRPASGRLLALILLGYGATWAEFFPPIITLLPLRVKAIAPDDYTTALSVVLVSSAVVGLLVGPIAGAVSDRSRSRFGRRRFWLVVFSAIGAVGNVVLGVAGDLVTLTVGACVAQIGFAATSAVLFALIPEHVPAARRGKIGALLGVGTALATVVGVGITAVLAGSPLLAWVGLSVLGLGAIVLLCAFLPDAPDRGTRPAPSAVGMLRSFWIDPRRHPDFAWAWLSRFALYLAFASVTTYQVFYLIDQIGVGTAEDAARYAGVGTAVQVGCTVLGAGLGGLLSDRVGRRKPFVIGAAVIGLLALVFLTLATSLPLYLVGVALIGIANGCYVSVDVALVTSLLPAGGADAGKDLGIVNVASMLPNTIAPAFAPLLLSIGVVAVVPAEPGHNYTVLFLASAVFALVSAVTLLKVKTVR